MNDYLFDSFGVVFLLIYCSRIFEHFVVILLPTLPHKKYLFKFLAKANLLYLYILKGDQKDCHHKTYDLMKLSK